MPFFIAPGFLYSNHREGLDPICVSSVANIIVPWHDLL